MRQKLLVLVALALAIAQGLAAEPTLPRGDVDGNGQITITDVTQVINVLLHNSDNMVADVNGDGLVTIADVTELITILLNGSEISFSATLQANPNSLYFGDINVGESKQQFFYVSAGTNMIYDISLEMQNTSPNADFYIFPETLPPYGGYVYVTCRATSVGPFNETLRVSANNAHINVSLSGNVVDAGPSFLVIPTSLNFGNVIRDQTKTMSFAVTGTNLVNSLMLSSDNSYFSVSPTTITSENGNVIETVTVAYNPTAFGNHSGVITVSDGIGSKAVSVSGTCPRPSISVSTSQLDFGTFIPGDTISREFFVVGTNTVDDISLTLQNTPTYAEFTISPEILPPGGGTVTVTCESCSEGDIFGNLVVSTTGATERVIDLEGECVEPFISINPNQLDFGEMLVDESKQLTFRVTGTNTVGNISLALQNTSSNADLTISPYPPTLPPSGGTVTVTCDAYREGDFSGKIILSSAGANDVTLNLSGTVVGPNISVYPTSLDFGNMYVGQIKEMTFTVEGTNTVGNISLTLPGTSTNADFTVSPEILPSSGGTVTVTCSATGIGDINETLLVSANGVEDETVTLSGTAAPNPSSIIVTPTSLNFGTLKRGEMRSKTFTVTGQNLTGNLSISCDSYQFVVDRTVITPELAASGVTVNVIYNAFKFGDISGTITISGGGAPSKTVSLTAVCEPTGGDFY